MQQLIFNWLKDNWELLAGYGLNSIVTILVAIPKSNAAFWKIVRLLHGALDKIDPKATSAALVLMLALPLLNGCTNVQEKINSALEYESKVQAEAQSLEKVAIAAIVLLPPEKQAKAYDDLALASTAFAQAIAAKSDALQAINAGLSSDWGALVTSIQACAGALEALGKIILAFGAPPERVNAAMARVAQSEGFTVARLSK